MFRKERLLWIQVRNKHEEDSAERHRESTWSFLVAESSRQSEKKSKQLVFSRLYKYIKTAIKNKETGDLQ